MASSLTNPVNRKAQTLIKKTLQRVNQLCNKLDEDRLQLEYNDLITRYIKMYSIILIGGLIIATATTAYLIYDSFHSNNSNFNYWTTIPFVLMIILTIIISSIQKFLLNLQKKENDSNKLRKFAEKLLEQPHLTNRFSNKKGEIIEKLVRDYAEFLQSSDNNK